MTRVSGLPVALSDPISPEAADYLSALIAGDVARAREVVQQALRDGMTLQRLYLSVFQEALYEVGHLWQSGRVSVAQEHLASATTQALMARAWARLPACPPHGRQAIVTATDRDLHALGARFLSDFLEADGWTVFELGAATPVPDLTELADQVAPDLVCLSTTLTRHLPEARAAILALRALSPPPVIAVGGQAYGADAAFARSLGADLFAPDAGEFLLRLRARFADPAAP